MTDPQPGDAIPVDMSEDDGLSMGGKINKAFHEHKAEMDVFLAEVEAGTLDFPLFTKAFSALSTERRLKIMRLLMDSPEPVASSMIAAVTGVAEAPTSYNLTALVKADLVTRIPSGRWVFYTVNHATVEKLGRFFRLEIGDETS